MKTKKTAWMLAIIFLTATLFSACALFEGNQTVNAEGLPELGKRYYYSPGEHFVVNLKADPPEKDEDGNVVKNHEPALCKASVALLTVGKDMTEELEQNQPAIRNIVVRNLRDMTEEQARAENVIDQLEETMTEQLKEFLGIPEFHAVYISDYVVQ